MSTPYKALCLILLLAGALFGQGTAYDCAGGPFTWTASTSTTIVNTSNTNACRSWAITFSSTSTLSSTLTFSTSPDNSSFTNVPNTQCTGATQQNCWIDGANPLPGTSNGTASFRTYAAYVRVSIVVNSGSGTGTVKVYGYKGLSANAGNGSGGGGGGGGMTVAGTTNQISTTGTCNDTAGTCTVQLPNTLVTIDPTTGSFGSPGSYSAGVGGTKSGAVFETGVTDGKSQGFSVNDTAGVSILYLMPSAAGAANQVLSDSGVVTCPTLATGAPAVCHQLIWHATTGVGIKVVSAVSLPANQPETCTDSNGDLTTVGCGAGSNTGNSVTSTTPVTKAVNTTGDQQLMELSLSAGYLNTAGQPFQITGAGIYSTVALQTPTLEFKVKLCTISGCGSGTVVTLVDITSTVTLAGNTNNNWFISFLAATATTGGSGKLEIHGPAVVDLGATTATADSVFGDLNTAASGTIDLTAALFLDFTLAFSTNTASPNSVTQRLGGIMPYAATAGGGGTPGGFPGQTQYNNSGAFGGVDAYVLPNRTTAGGPVASLPQTGWTVFGSAYLMDFASTFTSVRILDSATLTLRGITRAISIPYTIIAVIDCSADQPNLNAQACSVGISDGTKFQDIENLYQTATSLSVRVQNWTNNTTAGTTPAGPTGQVTQRIQAFKIVNNSTNRIYSYWKDGAWVQLLSQASGTSLTETTAGVFGVSNTSNAGGDMDVRLLYWSVQ